MYSFPSWEREDGQTDSQSGTARQLKVRKECYGSPPLPGDLKNGCLLFYCLLRFNLTAYYSTKNNWSHWEIFITSQTTILENVCFLVVSKSSCPCLKTSLIECVCMCAHPRCPPPWDTDFPQGSCALTGKVRGGWFFFLTMEKGGDFYDPCSLSSCKNHTSRFPSVAASSAT